MAHSQQNLKAPSPEVLNEVKQIIENDIKPDFPSIPITLKIQKIVTDLAEAKINHKSRIQKELWQKLKNELVQEKLKKEYNISRPSLTTTAQLVRCASLIVEISNLKENLSKAMEKLKRLEKKKPLPLQVRMIRKANEFFTRPVCAAPPLKKHAIREEERDKLSIDTKVRHITDRRWGTMEAYENTQEAVVDLRMEIAEKESYLKTAGEKLSSILSKIKAANAPEMRAKIIPEVRLKM